VNGTRRAELRDFADRWAYNQVGINLHAALDEIEKLRAALTNIASGTCWNARETARYALGGQPDDGEGSPR